MDKTDDQRQTLNLSPGARHLLLEIESSGVTHRQQYRDPKFHPILAELERSNAILELGQGYLATAGSTDQLDEKLELLLPNDSRSIAKALNLSHGSVRALLFFLAAEQRIVHRDGVFHRVVE